MKAFPHERAIPFIKLDILKLVALCSGRLTSVIRASQLGILADWTADANMKEEKIYLCSVYYRMLGSMLKSSL